MKSKMLIATAAIIAAILLSFPVDPALSAQRVSIVQDIEGHSSQVAPISYSTAGGSLAIDFDVISIVADQQWNTGYSQVSLPDGDRLVAGSISEIGMPQLPLLSTFVGIPDNAGITVSADYESYEIIENIDVMPFQVPTPEGGEAAPAAFVINNEAYSRDAFYPEQLCEAGEPVIMQDVRMAQVVVYPVQYNPVRHQLKIYRNITVNISHDGEVINPLTNRRPYLSEAFMPLYRTTLANFDAYIASLSATEIKRGGYIIIVPNLGSYLWKAPMKQFADWKRAKGYDVRLVTTSEINTNGHPTAAQIKTFLTNAYNTWPVRPDFVCIVGDEDLNSGGELVPDYPYSYYTSDHQYACLNGSDWIPDVGVARASVDNITELNAFIAKTLVYEKNPLVSGDREYLVRGVSVSTDRHAISPVWTCLWVKERLLWKGFTQVDTFFQRANYTPPASAIAQVITNGVGIINYRGWAGSSGWWEPPFNTGNLSSCNNINKPGVMTSIVCGTGNYGVDVCFGETYIRMGTQAAPKGGPAFFGATDGNTHTQWNNPITIGFYRGLLYDDIYHFAMAAVAGKMRQKTVYPRAQSTIQQYFHTYNMLGDPELEMRISLPVQIAVSFEDTIILGMNYTTVNVSDVSMRPMPNAYVTLIMADSTTERFFSVGKTDSEGNALIRVPTDTTGTLKLTVSGRELIPFQGQVVIVPGAEIVGYHSSLVDDDDQGLSSGDSNGMASPDETIELSIILKNAGVSGTALNVTADLVAVDADLVTVHRSTANYGNIAPGDSAFCNDNYVIGINPSAKDGDIATLRLDIRSTDDSIGWQDYMPLSIVAPNFRITGATISGNNRLDPGDTATVALALNNFGHLDAGDVRATISTTSGYVQVSPQTSYYGPIDIGDTIRNSLDPFTVIVDPAAFKGQSVPFKLSITTAEGGIYEASYNLTIGQVATSDPGGPDAYGYFVYDDLDVSYSERPTFNWYDARTNGGTNLNLSDDSRAIVNLPFTFKYYGRSHNRISVCSNGWICMDSTQWVSFRNWPFPDPANAPAMIAPFWDDLGPSGRYNIFTKFDTLSHRFIIQWDSVSARTYTARQTFQVVLYDQEYYPTISGDGMFEFVYRQITNGETDPEENYATVGFENHNENIGFNVTYSNTYSPGCATLAANRVYRITTNTGRGRITGSVTVTGGGNDGVKANASTGQYAMSNAAGAYLIDNVPPDTIDVTFSKTGWFPQTIANIMVNPNQVVSGQNATLVPCPVPANLAASDSFENRIELSWSAVSHPDLIGYDIYRSRWENGVYSKINGAPINGVIYNDVSVTDTNAYWYYVVAVFGGANYQAQSLGSNKTVGYSRITTGINENNGLPTEFALAQNYPNPFNARTVIRYSLPISGRVSLDIFNIMGQKVATLLDSYRDTGYHSVIWDGHDFNGNTVSSGIYFYRLNTEQKTITKRMLILK